jgi:hypothetical protein
MEVTIEPLGVMQQSPALAGIEQYGPTFSLYQRCETVLAQGAANGADAVVAEHG